jgi:hypothetical protein
VIPHYREDDNEHVGYLVPDGDLFVPTTLIHTPLAEAMPMDDAIARLDWRGLAELNERWWARMPQPAAAGVDLSTPDEDWQWRPVHLIEVRPDALSLKVENPTMEEFMSVLSLPNPPGDLLRREQP